MLKTGLVVTALIIYLLVLGKETDRAIGQWKLRNTMPAIGYLVLIQLCFNAGFFVWTCLVIYQLLFDLQPTTYAQVQQLIPFALIELIIEIMIDKRT